MNIYSIDVVTYFYSRTGHQTTPLYVDGTLENFSASKYGSDFIEDILIEIINKTNDCKVVSDSEDGLDCSAYFSINARKISIHFKRSFNPCSIKENDCWRLNDKVEKTEWFVHHVAVNSKYFDDTVDSKQYILQLISSTEADPTSAAVA